MPLTLNLRKIQSRTGLGALPAPDNGLDTGDLVEFSLKRPAGRFLDILWSLSTSLDAQNRPDISLSPVVLRL